MEKPPPWLPPRNVRDPDLRAVLQSLADWLNGLEIPVTLEDLANVKAGTAIAGDKLTRDNDGTWNAGVPWPSGNYQDDPTFPGIQFTTDTVNPGGTVSGSIPWPQVAGGRTALVRHVRVEMSTPTLVEFRILRQADFAADGLAKNVAFHATEVGEDFMREFVWDYTDEDGGGALHYWIRNFGNSASQITVKLNMRVPQ